VRVTLGPIATTFNATIEIVTKEPANRIICTTRGRSNAERTGAVEAR